MCGVLDFHCLKTNSDHARAVSYFENLQAYSIPFIVIQADFLKYSYSTWEVAGIKG